MKKQSDRDNHKIWRNPAIESTDIYRGLVVQDDRVGGSITVRSSRLPLWVLIRTAIQQNWTDVQDGWNVDEYNYTAEEFAEFLHNLLESRGEFARLLLEMANANRENDWFSDEMLKVRIQNQLRLCLESLTNGE